MILDPTGPPRPAPSTTADFEQAVHALERTATVDAKALASLERAFAAQSRFMSAHATSSLKTRLANLKAQCSASAPSFDLDKLGIPVPAAPRQRVSSVVAIDVSSRTADAPSLVDRHDETIEWRNLHSTLHLRNLRNCRVFLGPCSGAIFLVNVESCEIHMAAHQIRLVQCRHTRLMVHVATSVNLEDCQDIQVHAVVPWYEGFAADMEAAGLDGPNRCDRIINFTDI